MRPKLSWVFFSLLIFADQISKIASDSFSGDFYFINRACNKNIAWGLPVSPAFFYLLWFAIIFFLTKYFLQAKNELQKLGLIFILSGAASNMIDRTVQGCVIDFIDLKFWPVFNLADTYITIGIVIFLISKILSTKHEIRNNT
jgi:signal peptidase II